MYICTCTCTSDVLIRYTPINYMYMYHVEEEHFIDSRCSSLAGPDFCWTCVSLYFLIICRL